MRPKIAVFGSATATNNNIKALAREVGEEIAKNDCILITGATSGYSYEAAIGAKNMKGFVIGISPAENKKEHREVYERPMEHFDAIIYSGQGYTGRNALNARSADAAIIINGGIGTLTEFCNSYEEGKIIGVLDGTGGVTVLIKGIVDNLYVKTASVVIHDDKPRELIRKVILQLKKCGEMD